jgi:hypothetical protein
MDQIDHAIIDTLRANGRASYADIGAEVNLSASAAKRRVDRLVEDGVIQGFTIQVDPALDGMGTEAYVELFCRGTVAPHDLKRILSAVPEVVDAATVTGRPTRSYGSGHETSPPSRWRWRASVRPRRSTTPARRSCSASSYVARSTKTHRPGGSSPRHKVSHG